MRNLYIIVAVLALGACSTWNTPYDGKPLLSEVPQFGQDINDWYNENLHNPVMDLLGGPHA